jgi:hypothetical protein
MYRRFLRRHRVSGGVAALGFSWATYPALHWLTYPNRLWSSGRSDLLGLASTSAWEFDAAHHRRGGCRCLRIPGPGSVLG